jgi:hypothetical protein
MAVTWPRSGSVERSRLDLEGAWAAMKNGLGNLAARDVDQLAAIMKNRLPPATPRSRPHPAPPPGAPGPAGLNPIRCSSNDVPRSV